jgi:hypothetical protein
MGMATPEIILSRIARPPLFESTEIVGKEKVLERVRGAIEMLEKYR